MRDLSGEVAIGGKLEVAGVLGSIINYFNVTRLQTVKEEEEETIT